MNQSLKYQLTIVVAAMLLFIPFLGNVHLFDWDEINFAECAREMIVSGNYFSVQINYQPFWEKPPLFIWMQALSMNIFGINEFAARLPNAICGIATLLVLFNIGKKLINDSFGAWWALVYTGSFLPHFYFKSGIIDPWFNLFIFCGIYFFIVFTNTSNIRNLLLSATLIGLAMLTKGPVALLLFGLCIVVFTVLNKFKLPISITHLFIFGVTALSVGGLWFLMLFVTGHANIIQEFFEYQLRLFNTQDSGHGGPFFYHWIVLLIGCFPSSIIALQAFKKNNSDIPSHSYFKKWMLILFWVVLILFSIVKTKIVHYSSLCYFPLSFLCAYSIYHLVHNSATWKKTSTVLLTVIGALISAAIMLLPLVDKYKNIIIESNLIADKFAVENLKAQVNWWGYEWLIGAFLLCGTLGALHIIKNKNQKKGLQLLFLVSLVSVNLSMTVIVPRIEQYSQNAAIEFYKQLKNKNCYVETLGFKSYAYLFYSQKKHENNDKSYDLNWLLNGKVNKPVYFVARIHQANDIKNNHPALKELYQKNGFVFFERSTILP